MLPDLAACIEAHLLSKKGWVTAAELCDAFQVTPRSLRASGGKPGLCSHCAISGDKGFRHLANASEPEFNEAHARIRRHGLGELAHARQLLNKRRLVATARKPVVFEDKSDQALLLPT